MLIVGDEKTSHEILYDILVDDGSKRKINIPVGLINYNSREILKEYLK